MKDFSGEFLAVGLDLKGAKHNFLDNTDNIARIQTSCTLDYYNSAQKGGRSTWISKKWKLLTTFLEENRQNIFYLLVFFAVNVWLFAERFIRKSN